ncbi:MAG: YdbL family protein [Kiloniellaceae bacterium]
MLRRFRSCFAVPGAVVLVLALYAAPAVAQSLDALHASGAVGERFDGYAEARQPSAAATVKEINAKRRTIYQQRAAAQGAPVEQVGRIYAQQIFQKAPPGTWFLRENGEWMQK